MLTLSSSTKVWIFILATSLSLLVIGYNTGERLGLIICFFLSVLFNLLIFVYGDYKLQNFFTSYEIKGQDSYGILKTLNQLSQKLNTEVPRVKIFESESVNAFTLSLFWNPTTVYLSSNLVKKLSPQELSAVLTLCIYQIRRMDSFAFAVVSVIANSILGLAEFLDQFLIFNFWLEKKIKLFSWILLPFSWILIKSIALSTSYYTNDRLSGELIGDKRLLCETLWKLKGYSLTYPLEIPPGTSHLFIVQPKQSSMTFFETIQPSVKKRIIKLIGHSPL